MFYILTVNVYTCPLTDVMGESF